MNGIDLSRQYYKNTAEPKLKTDFPEIFDKIAAGLVGNGSECFGYDDETSRDHDWGIDFFLWLPEELREYIPRLHQWRLNLLETNKPEFSRSRSEYGARIGVMTVGDFYKQLIGFPEGPETLDQWRIVPEENLAMTVNGEIFSDPTTQFTAVREKLLRYIPEDLRLKRISAKCMAIAQTGQYNFRRMASRNDWVTVQTTLSRFNDAVIALVFLLNKVYRPYYKWAWRKMTELPILGAELSGLLQKLCLVEGFTESTLVARDRVISEICGKLINELHCQHLAESDDWFMTTHGEEIRSKIGNNFLRSLPAQYEI